LPEQRMRLRTRSARRRSSFNQRLKSLSNWEVWRLTNLSKRQLPPPVYNFSIAQFPQLLNSSRFPNG
jgi:hypothetical protein